MAPEHLGWFRMLGIGTSFLASPLEYRKTNLHKHQQDETTAKLLRVVNDSAEWCEKIRKSPLVSSNN